MYMPHGFCVNWDQFILFRSIFGNAMTAIAYFSIPFSLLAIKRSSSYVGSSRPISLGLSLFSAFIFLCGAGHLLDIVIIWLPAYKLQSWWSLATGTVSVFTAAALMKWRKSA